jgi:hypothetical protein
MGINPDEPYHLAISEEKRIAVNDPFNPGGLGISGLRGREGK